MTSANKADSISARDHMDGIHRYQRYIYDATRKFYLLGRDKLIHNLNPPDGGSVLEIGCGTGRNLIYAAQRYPQARFFGIDISTAMLETAQKSVKKAKITDRVHMFYGDATCFDSQTAFGLSYFDRIFISYALSMIPSWRDVLHNAFGRVAPGGSLHIVDFGQQEHLPAVFRKMIVSWLKQFSVFPIADLKEEMNYISRINEVNLAYDSLYRDYAVYAVLRKDKLE